VGALYQDMNRLAEAESLLTKSLEVRRRVMGDEQPRHHPRHGTLLGAACTRNGTNCQARRASSSRWLWIRRVDRQGNTDGLRTCWSGARREPRPKQTQVRVESRAAAP
jgi:hypothetical protein